MRRTFGQDSGVTNIATGIASLLAPIAQVGVSVYQSKQLAKLEKARAKADAAAQSAMIAFSPQPIVVQSSSGLLIGVVVGGVVLMGLLVYLLTRKKTVSADSTDTPKTNDGAAQPERKIKRIKRISRPKNLY